MRSKYIAIGKVAPIAISQRLLLMSYIVLSETSDLSVKQQVGEERRRITTSSRVETFPKTLISWCRISMDGLSEACSPEGLCTQSPEWGRLEDSVAKGIVLERET
jgi:hypothetical protein